MIIVITNNNGLRRRGGAQGHHACVLRKGGCSLDGHSKTGPKSVTNKPKTATICPKERFGYNHPGYDHLYVVLNTGRHYLSNATCLRRPRLLHACLVVSRIAILCNIIRHF